MDASSRTEISGRDVASNGGVNRASDSDDDELDTDETERIDESDDMRDSLDTRRGDDGGDVTKGSGEELDELGDGE